MASFIVSTGVCLPDRIVPNDELGELLGIPPSVIEKKSGIKERRWAADDAKTSELAAKALKAALSIKQLEPAEIRYLLVGTMSPDRFIPGCASAVQVLAGLERVPCLDIRAACCNALYALQIADALLASSVNGDIAIALAEIQSRYLTITSSSGPISMLFGDGAAALIVSDKPRGPSFEILDILLRTDGEFVNDLGILSPGTEFPRDRVSTPVMNGLKVISFARRELAQTCRDILERNNLAVSEVGWMVPHQANLNLLHLIADDLRFPVHRIITSLRFSGNTSSASMGIALHELVQNSSLRTGEILILPAFAAGFTWGAALCRAV